mmetsp:Transcript_47783/g.125136  ORF Transcript_47783/g.125136 Transcript_47783/m.125136 type:complete len:343 (-) Transcript_47783:1014-2042(-)
MPHRASVARGAREPPRDADVEAAYRRGRCGPARRGRDEDAPRRIHAPDCQRGRPHQRCVRCGPLRPGRCAPDGQHGRRAAPSLPRRLRRRQAPRQAASARVVRARPRRARPRATRRRRPYSSTGPLATQRGSRHSGGRTHHAARPKGVGDLLRRRNHPVGRQLWGGGGRHAASFRGARHGLWASGELEPCEHLPSVLARLARRSGCSTALPGIDAQLNAPYDVARPRSVPCSRAACRLGDPRCAFPRACGGRRAAGARGLALSQVHQGHQLRAGHRPQPDVQPRACPRGGATSGVARGRHPVLFPAAVQPGRLSFSDRGRIRCRRDVRDRHSGRLSRGLVAR